VLGVREAKCALFRRPWLTIPCWSRPTRANDRRCENSTTDQCRPKDGGFINRGVSPDNVSSQSFRPLMLRAVAKFPNLPIGQVAEGEGEGEHVII